VRDVSLGPQAFFAPLRPLSVIFAVAIVGAPSRTV
jgi:hypothetical protein